VQIGGPNGNDPRCQAGPLATSFVEIGVLARGRYEVALTIHPLSLIEADSQEVRSHDNAPIAPLGISFSYHL
jgi:hypothetical protein